MCVAAAIFIGILIYDAIKNGVESPVAPGSPGMEAWDWSTPTSSIPTSTFIPLPPPSVFYPTPLWTPPSNTPTPWPQICEPFPITVTPTTTSSTTQTPLLTTTPTKPPTVLAIKPPDPHNLSKYLDKE